MLQWQGGEWSKAPIECFVQERRGLAACDLGGFGSDGCGNPAAEALGNRHIAHRGRGRSRLPHPRQREGAAAASSDMLLDRERAARAHLAVYVVNQVCFGWM
jgi:hypothetical protein